MEIDKIVEGLDKQIVANSVISFNRNNDVQKLVLTDDGIVEQYLNEKLYKSFNFSKLGLLRECKNILQEGYNLNEADIQNTEDKDENILDNPEQTKQDLQKDIKDVEEIQKLQDELDTKLDSLNEDSEILDYFPSTDFSEEPLSFNDVSLENFKTNLTDEQIKWIETNIGSLEDFTEALYALYYVFGDGLVSIDDYAQELYEFINNGNTLNDYINDLKEKGGYQDEL